MTSAPAAPASTAFTFGQGRAPDLAVDPAGTAHLAWNYQYGGYSAAIYCQIPRGARACTNKTVLATGVSAHPHVFLPSPGRVLVMLGMIDCGFGDVWCTLVSESKDGGANFGQPKPVTKVSGQGFYASASTEAVYGPFNAISFVNDGNPGVYFTFASLGGQIETSYAKLAPAGTPAAFDATVGLHDNLIPVVVYSPEDAPLRWTAFDGTGDPNDQGNWTSPQPIEQPSDPNVVLAGGPNGLFVLYRRETPSGDQYVVRKFTGSGWKDATPVSGAAGLRDADLSQDASGRLHAIWLSENELLWRTSTDPNGADWGETVTINVGDMYHPRVAAAGDGLGLAVWDPSPGLGAFSDLRAVPLEPFDFPAPAPPPPPPANDETPPTLTGFGVADSTLNAGQGTSFVFDSSEPGNARLMFYKLVKGLKMKRQGRLRCLAKTTKRLHKLHHTLLRKPAVERLSGKPRKRMLARLMHERRCSVAKRLGQILRLVRAGRNEIVFSGTLDGRELRPGRYRAVLVVTDASGNASRHQTVSFRVFAREAQSS